MVMAYKEGKPASVVVCHQRVGKEIDNMAVTASRVSEGDQQVGLHEAWTVSEGVKVREHR